MRYSPDSWNFLAFLKRIGHNCMEKLRMYIDGTILEIRGKFYELQAESCKD